MTMQAWLFLSPVPPTRLPVFWTEKSKRAINPPDLYVEHELHRAIDRVNKIYLPNEWIYFLLLIDYITWNLPRISNKFMKKRKKK